MQALHVDLRKTQNLGFLFMSGVIHDFSQFKIGITEAVILLVLGNIYLCTDVTWESLANNNDQEQSTDDS